MDIMTTYKQWKTSYYFDKKTRDELAAIENDPEAIRDRFYRELDFGTAGIRGVIGAGTNRINLYVVRKVSHAVATYISNLGSQARQAGIVIGYDSRNFSKEFAMEAASIFAGYDIKTLMHPEICPVPVLSYSITKFKCVAGVMITASHNPKQYNGYKVYGSDGAQLGPDASKAISDIMNSFEDYSKLATFSFDYLKQGNKIKILDGQVKKAFSNALLSTIINKKEFLDNSKNLSVVYTPLHGCGAKWVPECLKACGVGNVYTVDSQMIPDGNFSTVKVPNPENAEAMELAVVLAKEKDADLAIATDPDSDRAGVVAKDKNGKYIMLTGNQIGIILLDRAINCRIAAKKPIDNALVISSIVSTRVAKAMCEANCITYKDVPVGFRYIGDLAGILEDKENKKFIFGFEESCGYLFGNYAKDKDAIGACVYLAEAASYYKSKGLTLIDALDSIYEKYGFQHEIQVSLVLKGESGLIKTKELMDCLRNKKADIIDVTPSSYTDMLQDGGEISKCDMISATFENGYFMVRPSGTEPKVKIYFGGTGETRSAAYNNTINIKNKVTAAILDIVKDKE